MMDFLANAVVACVYALPFLLLVWWMERDDE